MKKPSLATVINYCSNDRLFLKACIENIQTVSDQILIPVCDHFFDGTPEKIEELNTIFQSFPHCQFLLYPYSNKVKEIFSLQAPNEKHLWHSLSRLISFFFLKKDIDFVLFLDSDEILERKKFEPWLSQFPLEKFFALKLACYWYFRSPCYQALQWEDSPVLIKAKFLSPYLLLQKDERDALFNQSLKPFSLKKRQRAVLGLDEKPFIHHYSWVRTKEEMLKKVSSWGHAQDKNWKALVEKEFSSEFQGKDFVHGYDFVTVPATHELENHLPKSFQIEKGERQNVEMISEEFLLEKVLLTTKKPFFSFL